MNESVSVDSVSHGSVRSMAVSQTVTVSGVRVTRSQQMTTMYSVSQGMTVSVRSFDHRLLDFGDVSDRCGNMSMSQTVPVSQGSVSVASQMTSVSMAMSQTVGSNAIIVSSDWGHVFGHSRVGRHNWDCVVSSLMSESMSIDSVSVGRVCSVAVSKGCVCSMSVAMSQGCVTRMAVRQRGICGMSTVTQVTVG